MNSLTVKLVVFVPESHADILRSALGNAGAGQIGNYTHCSFSSAGIGRFTPNAAANPHIGQSNKPESVKEERIEFLCERKKLPEILKALKNSHPYEEIAFDVYPLENVSI